MIHSDTQWQTEIYYKTNDFGCFFKISISSQGFKQQGNATMKNALSPQYVVFFLFLGLFHEIAQDGVSPNINCRKEIKGIFNSRRIL